MSSPDTELAAWRALGRRSAPGPARASPSTLVYIAEYALVMRSSLLDELGEDYLTTARAKGLRDDLVRRRHAVPNALLPTVTLIFLNLGFVVSGAITVETVFSWPGLGLLTLRGPARPDFPLLQGLFLLFSAAVILMNLVADLLYAVPRPAGAAGMTQPHRGPRAPQATCRLPPR